MTQTLRKILYVEDDDHIEVMVGRDVIYDCHSVVALLNFNPHIPVGAPK